MEKIIQFGEGNFLRAFIEEYAKKAEVVAVKPRPGKSALVEELESDGWEYDLYVRGLSDGKIVSEKKHMYSISRILCFPEDKDAYLALASQPQLRFIVSNTTEAGIEFKPSDSFENWMQASFPGKLTRLLYERFRLGGGGFIILPCELSDDNGYCLKDCVLRYSELWELGEDFAGWVKNDNLFCNTLVDRIVTGHPADSEKLSADSCEVFKSWIIEGPALLKNYEFLSDESIRMAKDHAEFTAYRERKLRMLNAVHTSLVPGAYLDGERIVRDTLQKAKWESFTVGLFRELERCVDLPIEDLKSFEREVLDRFRNPYIDHKLIDIALNSASKWRVRCLPAVKKYIERENKLPALLCKGLGYLIEFYRSGYGRDSEEVLAFFAAKPPLMDILANETLWGENLNAIPGLYDYLDSMLQKI